MRSFSVFAVLISLVFAPMTANAIDLRNEDTRNYKVKVKSSAMVKDVQLKSRSMSIIICVGKCQFTVPGVGKVSGTGSDIITIRNGRIEKKAGPPRRVAKR
ncbi:MAG: hypothetical protein ACI9MR_000642 [Myxococcota bacterium]|jgi:hypothetical protein